LSQVVKLGRPTIFNIKAYIPGKPIEEVEREYGITGVIKLASNENPLGAAPLAIEALRRAIANIHTYPDGNCYYLKEALASHLGCQMDNLIIGNGSDELLKLIAETFLSPRDEVIFADPSFGEYEFVTRVMDANPVPVHLNEDFQHDLQAMAAAVTERTKLVVVCNPNNPTGTMVSGTEMDQFLKELPEQVVVVLDEAYFEYVSDTERYPNSLKYMAEGKNVIVLRTFSKIYGLAGLRVGYGIAAPEIVAMLNRVREPFNVNSLAQAAATAALNDHEHLRRSRQVVADGIDFLCRNFDRLQLKYLPTQTNFIFVDIGRDSRQVFSHLLKAGVIIRTGDIFGYPKFIRVTIGTAEENKRFVALLENILHS
jgi:histidinol-phosphate aminotransferase